MSPPEHPFQYALLRVVPHIERGERLNAGVVLFCRARGFLSARIALDEELLATLAPTLDLASVRSHLDALARVAGGDPAAGPVARLEPSERFHWLVAPSSTVIQPSKVHTGFSADPERDLQRLTAALVARELAPLDGPQSQ